MKTKKKKKLYTYIITGQEQVSHWQNVTYVVEATSEEEAKSLIIKNPQTYCVGVDDVLFDTESVIEVDFENNYSCEIEGEEEEEENS